MRTIEIHKNNFGLRYRLDGHEAWRYFPDRVESRDQMIEYFKTGKHGFSDGVELVFVDDTGKQSKHYKLIAKKFDSAMLRVDGEKVLRLEPEQFLSVQEQIATLMLHTDREVFEEASALTDEHERLKVLKEETTPAGRDALHNRMTGAVTDQKIRELCEAHAKQFFNLPAQIEL